MEGANDASLEANLLEIRDLISQSTTSPTAKATVGSLLTGSKPSQIMTAISSLLFQQPTPSTAEKLSANEALHILGFLVEVDTPSYLKPASRAVKEEALRLTNSASSTMHVSSELTAVLLHQLSMGLDVEVAQNSMEAITACCKKLGLEFTTTVLQGVATAMVQAAGSLSSNRVEASTICVRCAETIVTISVLEDATMQVALNCDTFATIMHLLKDEADPLLQMSMLDLLETLASARPLHSTRAHWLLGAEVLHPILGLTGGLTEDDAPDPILGGPALRVVVALCKLGSIDSVTEGRSESDGLVQSLYRALRNFDSSGEVDRLAFVDAVSNFASSSTTAMNLILNDTQTRDAWLSLSVAQPKLKASILVSVARVLDPNHDVDGTGEMQPLPSELRMKLFAALGRVNGPETTEILLSLARSPFPETRLGAYAMLQAVAKLPTGGQVLFTHGQFFEFLMNRDVEHTLEGREAKYEVVRTVLNSDVKGLLADEIVRQLEKYMSQGPHHVEPIQWEVAEQ